MEDKVRVYKRTLHLVSVFPGERCSWWERTRIGPEDFLLGERVVYMDNEKRHYGDINKWYAPISYYFDAKVDMLRKVKS